MTTTIKPVGCVLGGEFHYLTPRHGLEDKTMLYDQQAIDTLRAEVERLRNMALMQAARADAAEREARHHAARAERAEAEAKIGREFLQRIASQDAAFRPGWVHWCELARQGIAAIDAAKDEE